MDLHSVRKDHPGGRFGLLVALLEVGANVEEIDGRTAGDRLDLDAALAVYVLGYRRGFPERYDFIRGAANEPELFRHALAPNHAGKETQQR